MSADAPPRPPVTEPSQRRARLLIVGPLPPPIGGVETMTLAILESDAFREFEVSHCDTTKGRPKQTQGKFDLENFRWAMRHLGRMRRTIARVRPDVVYLPIAGTWSGFLRDMALAYVAKRRGARLVGHVHGGDFHAVLERRGPSARLVRAGLGQFDHLLVLGERWKKLLEAYGVRVKVAIVPSTLRREVFERGASFQRATSDAGQDGPVQGLFVGQVGRRKGVADLLLAVKRCQDMRLPFRMTFVGPPQLEGEWEPLLEMRRQLGLEAVTEFTGPLLGEALYERFRRGEIFLLPSYNEGLPVVFYEAGAFQMPVIATPVGAVTDLIVDGRNGLLVDPGRIESLVQAIVRLVRRPAERLAMGRQLREDIAAFHPDRVCARIAEEVHVALGDRRKPVRTRTWYGKERRK
jgi:glycosyltransferase involved in cell wall biosynthesis